MKKKKKHTWLSMGEKLNEAQTLIAFTETFLVWLHSKINTCLVEWYSQHS